jgi:hypothetical protein
MIREHVQQFRVGEARKALGFHRRDRGGDVEYLCRFCQRDNIVLQYLAVNRLDAECHLRLLIDENDLTVGGRQYFKLWITHGVIHPRFDRREGPPCPQDSGKAGSLSSARIVFHIANEIRSV